jgi:glycosyltransferase involved in cell wall biosynthesis
MGLISHLINKGYDVVTIAPADYCINKIEKNGCKFVPLYMDNAGTNLFKDTILLIKYLVLLYKEKPDFFLGFTIKPNIYGSLAAHYLGINVLNNISGLGTTFMKEGWLNQLVRILYRISLKNSCKVFFQNFDDLNTFVSGGIVKDRVVGCLPGSGIDLKSFSIVPFLEKPSVRFLLIARMLWDKGVGEFVKAAHLLKQRGIDAEFCLLGFLEVKNRSAISRKQMNEWTDKGIVSYLGVSDNVKEEIAKADCVVLPSYREGTPRSLLEAAAMARPVIAADSVGCRNVVDDQITGLLVRVKDPIDLADKMEAFSKITHSDRIKMGLNGREKIKREFDEEIVFREYTYAIHKINKSLVLNRS